MHSQLSTSGICGMTAVEMARAVRSREISSREVVAAHVERIAEVNPQVNALVTLVQEQALIEAELADRALEKGDSLGPLHGLPVAIKDLHETRGIRTTYGSPIFRDYVPEQDAPIVDRLKRAGAIVIGKSNTPEFGAGSQTFNEVFGVTRNPYDLTKTCGGSSGGAAVALACGMVPIADGSDMGGSLRNPASFCNVVGLRQSLGADPMSLSVDGPMGRTVADVALVFSAIAGAEFARPLERDFQGVRLAWAGNLGDVVFDSQIRAVVDAQRTTFESLCCVVEDAEPDFKGADEAFRIVRAWNFAANLGELFKTKRGLMKDTVVAEIECGLRLTDADVGRAMALRTALGQRMREFFEEFEYLILPVTQVPPFDVNLPYVKEIEGRKMETYIDWMKSCYYISITGHPAISVPGGFTREGLPVGLQIVGRRGGEFGVLQLAEAFEEVTGFGERGPVGRYESER